MTSQHWNAKYWAELSYKQGKGGGPAILTMTMREQRFMQFAGKYNIAVEEPMPRPPMAGMTETLVPFTRLLEFSSFTVSTLEDLANGN